jgi:hypothetical protein
MDTYTRELIKRDPTWRPKKQGLRAKARVLKLCTYADRLGELLPPVSNTAALEVEIVSRSTPMPVDLMEFTQRTSFCSVLFREPRSVCARVETPPSPKVQSERLITNSVELLPIPSAKHSSAPVVRPKSFPDKTRAVTSVHSGCASTYFRAPGSTTHH